MSSNATLPQSTRNDASACSVAVTAGDRLNASLLKKEVLLVFGLTICAVVGRHGATIAKGTPKRKLVDSHVSTPRLSDADIPE